MTTHFSFYAALSTLAMIFSLVTVSAQANPSSSNEAALGAAAIVVLAQKCTPAQAGYYQSQAQSHLAYMIQRFSESAKAEVFDDFRMKTRALQISSSTESCAEAQRLHSMASHWGYVHILETMKTAQ